MQLAFEVVHYAFEYFVFRGAYQKNHFFNTLISGLFNIRFDFYSMMKR